MSAEQPYLGSRISLISKSEIRYEGILYTIDTHECTVALAKVRSFGTEDRVTDRPVAPRDEVYEYIIFRGPDIKDIRVCDPPKPQPPPPPIGLPNDPAILQHSMAMPSSSAGFPLGFKQSFGPIGGLAYQPYPTPMMPQVPPFAAIPQQAVAAPSAPASESTGSRTTTPTKRKSPTMDQGTQVSGVQVTGREGRRADPRQPQRAVGGARGRGGQVGFAGQRQQQQQQAPQLQQQQAPQQQQQQQQQQPQQGYAPPGAGRGRGRPRGAGVVGGVNTGQQGQQTGASPRGGGGRGPNQGRPRSSTTLNFPGEYDFEQANAEFQELENQFAKAKINDKRDDSGNETAAGEGEQEDPDPVFYDKAKSFFDSISCEAIERSRGAFKRPDWRQERKLNVETFGVETNYRRRGFRGGRGGFRGGRGGYYGRGGRYRGRGGGQQMGFQRSGSQPTKNVGTVGRTTTNNVIADAGSHPVNNKSNWN